MSSKQAFAKALRLARDSKGLTQEDFSNVSSRTYISSLERALKSPTLEKVDMIAETLKIHPLTLLTLTYLGKSKSNKLEKLLDKVSKQVSSLSTDGD